MRHLLLTALLMGMVASGAGASPPVPVTKSPLDPSYIVELQFGPGVQPTYPGARFYRPVPVPGISVRRSDEPVRFSAPDDGFGVPILDASGFRLGPVGNVVIPRWRTHDELHGLHKIRPAVEGGVFVEYFPIEALRLRGELRHGLYGHEGIVATLGADYVREFRPATVSFGPRMLFGDTAWTNTYFGVKPYEALRNGTVRPYAAPGGLNGAGALSTLRVALDPVWSALAYGGVTYLVGSAGASPIPAVLGSRTQVSAGLVLARSLEVGPF